jgi:hypothetical protein
MLLPAERHVDARARAVAAAHAVLLLHVLDTTGSFCRGCLDLARLAPVPCPPSRAALSVVETHGTAVWEGPSEIARPG